MTQLTTAELIARYRAGERDFANAKLYYGAHLLGADLANVNLMRADLTGAYLRDANLNGANLFGAYLRRSHLLNTNLIGADLRGANLIGADLSDVDLRDAYLGGAFMSRAKLHRADLRDATLLDAVLRGADFTDCVMNWQSHDLIAERLRQAAGSDPLKRMAAGYVLMSRDWCWSELIANAPHIILADGQTLVDWALGTMRTWVRDGDNAPSILMEVK